MRFTKKYAIVLVLVALVLCLAQGILWGASMSHAPSETILQNRAVHQPPNELPGLAGLALLCIAGVLTVVVRPGSPD